MLSADQVNQLIKENEELQMQLESLNMVLMEKEQELQFLKEDAASTAELRSMLDAQLDGLQSLQNNIGEKERKVRGAEERELELQEELTEAARSQMQYSEMLQGNAYTQALLSDLQLQVDGLQADNMRLQKMAAKVAELESRLSNMIIERDELIATINSYKAHENV